MTRKHILSFIFVLLIASNNSLARPHHDNDAQFFKYVAVLSLAAFTAVIAVPKILQWLSSYINVSGISFSTNLSGNYGIINNEIIINPSGTPLDPSTLDLIQPSGKIETISFDQAIHTITVPGCIALICIDNNQQLPTRIERDTAFKDILFSVNNGTLTATTIDGKPRKFSYGGKHLCTIYAQLSSTSLKAQGSAYVKITNQKLNNIIIEGSATIIGSLDEKKTDTLNLGCYGSSDMQLTNINTQNLRIALPGSGNIIVQGNAENEEISVSGSGNYNGSQLTCQNGTIKATISGSGDVTTSGTANHQNVSIAGSGTYNGTRLTSKTATVNVKGSGDANINATSKIEGSVIGSGNVHYQQHPDVRINVTCKGSGRCKKTQFNASLI